VSSVVRADGGVVVTGNKSMLNAVISVLARNRIVAEHLRVGQFTMEDAYLALTGRHSATTKDQE
jgi:ABC-2 type transport system ATP-binding protein